MCFLHGLGWFSRHDNWKYPVLLIAPNNGGKGAIGAGFGREGFLGLGLAEAGVFAHPAGDEILIFLSLEAARAVDDSSIFLE